MMDAAKKRQWFASGQLDALKALALLAMLADHANKVLWEREFLSLAIIGRWAFPIFAGLLVWNLLYHTRQRWAYVARLLLAAIISQPAYELAFFHSSWSLNIFFTLAVAAALIAGFEEVQRRPHPLRAALWGAGVAGALVLTPVLEYGIIGLALMLSLYMALRQAVKMLWLLPALALLGLSIGWPPQGATLGVLPLIIAARWLPLPQRWPIPGWVWYAAYPAHLLLLAVGARV